MKSTFHTGAGSMLVVQQSPARGAVWITEIREDGSRCIIPIPVHLAGVVTQAIEATATTIEEACVPSLDALPATAL